MIIGRILREFYLREEQSKRFKEQEKEQFVHHPNGTLGAFSIYPKTYEQELNKKYGIEIKGITEKIIEKQHTNIHLPFMEAHYTPYEEIKEKILKQHTNKPGFCSMKVSTVKELEEHIETIHETSYQHYILAKEKYSQILFPLSCCGIGSRNMLFNLLEKGYANTTYIHNKEHNHSYITLPFTIDEINTKGFIIVDPTSDQLFNNKKIAPRNNLFISFGETWNYTTDWREGKNLYPFENTSVYANLHTIRKYPVSQGVFKDDNMEKYFEKIFKKTVKMDIKK